jgi:TRAP transporter TAXI family solute receptor
MVGLMPGMFVRKDSPIQKLSDLKGKRVSSGFASQKIIGEVVNAHLANGGLTYDDVKGIPAPNVVRAADDFMQNKTDVLFFALGSGAVLKASAKVGGMRFISLDQSDTAWARLKNIIPTAYRRQVKPSKRFHGVVKPSTVMAYDLAINTHAKASDDVVYKITKAIHGNKKIMAGVFRVLNGFFPKRMAKKTLVPYHSGAIKFYKEQGMWPPKG